MKPWGPWLRRADRGGELETRESQPFTDAVVTAIESQAAGARTGDPSAIAALESAAGLYARAFASADVQGPERVRRALRPGVRALIARDMIRSGESLFLIDVSRAGRIELLPAGTWDVRGDWRETSWFYRLDLFGPSGNITQFVPSDAVVHLRYAVDPARPWLGISPLGWARSTGALAANLEARLAEETGGVTAHLLPIPQDGGDGTDADPLGGLKTDIRNAKGGTVLVETTAAGWGEGSQAAPRHDYRPQRIGADPPDALSNLRSEAGLAVLGACGVPVSLFTDADGTSQRESSRRWLATGLQPLADLAAAELSDKMDADVRLTFDDLFLHDLQGRATAFHRLVDAGVDPETALKRSGLLAGDS